MSYALSLYKTLRLFVRAKKGTDKMSTNCEGEEKTYSNSYCIGCYCFFPFVEDCKSNLGTSLPTLPSSVRCNVPDHCTGVTCCVAEDSVLRHLFMVGVQLDDCNHVLTFEVEKLKIEIALKGYSFGKIFSVIFIGLITHIIFGILDGLCKMI